MIRTLIAVFVLRAVSIAATATVPTVDQSLGMKTVSGARISPDGRFVAYLVQEPNWEDNEFVQQIWIAVTATGERYALTSARKSSSDPRWSPGRWWLPADSDEGVR